MKKRYIFWPFDSTVSFDALGNARGVRTDMEEYKRDDSQISYVRYGSKKHRRRLENCNDPEKSIYVTGHGGAAVPFICPHPAGAGEAVGPKLLVERLREYGLKKTSKCRLKIFTCHSGSGGLFAYASLVAGWLEHFEYDRIEVYGYTADIIPASVGGQTTAFTGIHPEYGIGLWNHASAIRQPFGAAAIARAGA